MELRVGTVDDIPEGRAKVVEAGGKHIAVFNIKGEFHAISNVCPHRGGPLGEGFVSDNIVSCPLHDWQFDVRTGKCCMSPAIGVPTYQVEVRGEEVFVLAP